MLCATTQSDIRGWLENMNYSRETNKYILPVNVQKILKAIIKPEWCFLRLMLISGSCFAVLVPAGGGADEPNHIARAVSVAHGDMFADKIPDRVGYTSPQDVDGVDSALYGGVVDSALTDVAWHNMVDFHTPKNKGGKIYSFPTWTTQGMMSHRNVGEKEHVEAFSNSAVNSPFVYAPFALGYWLSRIFTSNAYAIIVIMRMFGLLTAAGILFFCIRYIPIGKWVLVSVSLMPTMVIFDATITADTMTYAMCISFITVVFKCMCENRALHHNQWILLSLVSISLALIKLSYVPLIILLALIPIANQYVRSKKDLFSLLGIMLCTGILFIGWYLAVSSINTGAMFDVGASPTLQKQYVFSHLITYMGLLVKQFIGQNFFNLGFNGTLDLHGHYAFTGWITVCVLICAVLLIDSRENRLAIFRKNAVWCCLFFLLAAACVFGLVETALYLQFSPVGADDIAGVQPRYFLPILPLLIVVVVIMTRQTDESTVQSDLEGTRGTQVLREAENCLGIGMMLSLQLISAIFTLYLLFTTLYTA